MKKTIVKIVVSAVVGGIMILLVSIANLLVERDNQLERISHWPNLHVKTMDGNEMFTRELVSDSPILFIYFSTECIFCRGVIKDILQHGQLQESVLMVFISDEKRETIEQYRHELGLEDKPKFSFLIDLNGEVKEFYGIHTVPATYLYGSEGELIQLFRGQIKADVLYSHFENSKNGKQD